MYNVCFKKVTPSIIANAATKNSNKVLNIGVVLLMQDKLDIVAGSSKEFLEQHI